MWEGIDAEMTRRRGTELGSEMAGMVAGIMPVTGIPLPYITHGGASLISFALA